MAQLLAFPLAASHVEAWKEAELEEEKQDVGNLRYKHPSGTLTQYDIFLCFKFFFPFYFKERERERKRTKRVPSFVYLLSRRL